MMSSNRQIGRHVALAFAVVVFLSTGLLVAQEAPTQPDMMDPLGRYQLQLPAHWKIVGTNSKLNGFVIGNGEDSFVAVYHDGKLSPDQALPTLAALCSCGVPDNAKVEAVSGAAYPSHLIQIGHDEHSWMFAGTAVFPGGMFALVSNLKNEQSRQALMDVLRQARPGPSRPK